MVFNWPLYSPDLDSIEQLWYELKKLIYQVCLNINSVTGSNDSVWKVFWMILEEVQTLIDIEMMKTLIGSMEKTIIAVDGWYIKY